VVGRSEGVTRMRIRKAVPADAAGIARVHVDSWRTTYRGLVPDEHLQRLSYSRGQTVWESFLQAGEEGRFIFVAEDPAGGIVGFASGGPVRTPMPRATTAGEGPDAGEGRPASTPKPGRYEGEIYAIYLLAEHQRRGTGTRLLKAAASELMSLGLTSMVIWVLADNPARRFYEALGGRDVSCQDIEIGGQVLEEVAYGWLDLRELLERRDISR